MAAVGSDGSPRTVTPIVALDLPDRAAAEELVTRLGLACTYYKVGLELYAAEGPAIVSWLRMAGKRVFVDLKLHDIPNTVRGAARSVARLGASLLTVHAVGGAAMVRAAVEGAAEGSGPEEPPCRILAVTILTSLDGATVGATWGRPAVDVSTEVVRLAGEARAGGAAGVVCSGHELAALRSAHGEALGYLVPGIRLAGGAAHDQQRVMTPSAAAAAGARWLVLGRAVTAAADPVAALSAVETELRALAMAPEIG
jgi:orotidine-5'-phosphate decarboxylase